MNFKETLERYHVSPLKYSDGTELNEKDYKDLYILLLKYFTAQRIVSKNKMPEINSEIVSKAEQNYSRALIKQNFEDIMDCLMEQKGGLVL